MTIIINVDGKTSNADWPKRTDDSLATLLAGGRARAGEQDKAFNEEDHPRDERGRFGEGAGDGSATTAAAEYQKLGTKAPAFKSWFGDWEHDPANSSKVLDDRGRPQEQYHTHSAVMEDGRPVVVYHGTDAQFTSFDPAKADKGALYGAGFYFTEMKELADTYQDKNKLSSVFLPSPPLSVARQETEKPLGHNIRYSSRSLLHNPQQSRRGRVESSRFRDWVFADRRRAL